MLRTLLFGRLPSTSVQQAWGSSAKRFSLSFVETRLSRFRQDLRFNTQRRPVSSPKASEYQKPELHPDQIPVRPAKDLWKAALFTVGIGCSAYTVAAVCEYSRMKHLRRSAQNFFTDFSFDDVFGQIKTAKKQLDSGLSGGDKATLIIMGINCIVSLLWRVPRLQTVMHRYFMNSFASKTLCSSMLLSVFSHINPIHLFLNMYVLYNFCPVATDRFLGMEQFFALYVTSGVLSSFTSLVHKCATKSSIGALGASGAICALLAYTCTRIPDARLSIVFLPFFQFSAEQAIYGLIAFDLLGLIFRFRMFDHAAHLGGTLFGVWYGMYGEHYVRHHFNPWIHKICHDAEKST